MADKICAEIMRALQMSVSHRIHLANDTGISGTLTFNRRPGCWVCLVTRGVFRVIRAHKGSVEMLMDGREGHRAKCILEC